MLEAALVIMAKEPVKGGTKTRLCPPLNLNEAAQLYEAFLLDTLTLVSNIGGLKIAVAVTPPNAVDYFQKITSSETILLPVDCKDIGECLVNTLGRLLALGYPKALALNSDGPTLPSEYIERAVNLLDEHDIVYGPSEDGGYYLVGLKRIYKELFQNISWSTSAVLEQSLANLQQLGLNVALLPEWYDIDTASDLPRLLSDLERLSPDSLTQTRRFFSDLDARRLSL